MKFSLLLHISAPAGLVIAQDIYKEDDFRIIIEKYGRSVKIKPK